MSPRMRQTLSSLAGSAVMLSIIFTWGCKQRRNVSQSLDIVGAEDRIELDPNASGGQLRMIGLLTDTPAVESATSIGAWGLCTGTLIHPTVVLTALHCVNGPAGQTLEGGALFYPGFFRGTAPEAAIVLRHERVASGADAALVYLDRPLNASGRMLLPERNEEVPAMLSAAGYGGDWFRRIFSAAVHQGCQVKEQESFGVMIATACDVTHGMSGGPLFNYRRNEESNPNGLPVLWGVNSSGDPGKSINTHVSTGAFYNKLSGAVFNAGKGATVQSPSQQYARSLIVLDLQTALGVVRKNRTWGHAGYDGLLAEVAALVRKVPANRRQIRFTDASLAAPIDIGDRVRIDADITASATTMRVVGSLSVQDDQPPSEELAQLGILTMSRKWDVQFAWNQAAKAWRVQAFKLVP